MRCLTVVLIGWLLVIVPDFPAARGQTLGDAKKLSDVIGGSTAPETEATRTETAAPTADNPEATVAEAAGTIDVEKPVNEDKIREFLEATLPKYPGVYEIQAEVENSVVTLTGHVEDDVVRDKMRDVALKVEGVVWVINQVKTDAQVLSAGQLVMKRVNSFLGLIRQKWLLAILALVVIIGSVLLARVVFAYGEILLAPLTSNLLLRSVLSSLLGAAIVIGGLFAGLTLLGLAQAVLSVLGLAGVVALAVGFAFRDITENFISSVLLGFRRPFRVGDFIRIKEFGGVVKSLNTRATVLVTLEGNQVRIPNATIFKEVMVNATASASVRETFDVLIPYEVSTTAAQEAITHALRGHDGIATDPPARTLVEMLEPGGVRLRSYYWFPPRGVDRFKLKSDLQLKAKVALQKAGISPPPTGVTVTLAGRVPVEMSPGDGEPRAELAPAALPGASVTPEQARANLLQDTRVADRASVEDSDAQDNALEHVLSVAQDNVSDEGENLLDCDTPEDTECAKAPPAR